MSFRQCCSETQTVDVDSPVLARGLGEDTLCAERLLGRL